MYQIIVEEYFADKMETQTKIAIGVVLALIATYTLVGDTSLEPTHFCSDRELKAFCYDLSSTGKTCYTQPGRIGGKRCSPSWEVIPELIEERILTTTATDKIHCTNKGCY